MPERLKSLPGFTCIDGGDSVNLWPDYAGSYTEANRVGRERAADLVEVIRRTESPVLLGHVVEAISAKPAMGGLEIGFFHALSMELLTPHVMTEFVTVPAERQFRVGRKVGHLSVVQEDGECAAARAAA